MIASRWALEPARDHERVGVVEGPAVAHPMSAATGTPGGSSLVSKQGVIRVVPNFGLSNLCTEFTYTEAKDFTMVILGWRAQRRRSIHFGLPIRPTASLKECRSC